jgi:hypothetical protein
VEIRHLYSEENGVWDGFVSVPYYICPIVLGPFSITIIFRRIVYNDLNAIAPEQYYKQITNRLAEIHAVSVSNQIQQFY